MNIVSLLPSATEIICELGLRDQLVGVSHECDYPVSVQTLPAVTQSRIPGDLGSDDIDRLVREQVQEGQSLYTLRDQELAALRPDLIVTQTLCDVCAVGEAEVQRALSRLPGSPRVLHLEPARLEEVFDSLEQVGQAAGRDAYACQVTDRLRQRVEAVRCRSAPIETRRSVVFLEWIDPPFSAGHWTPELIQIAGGQESLGQPGQNSQTLTWDRIFEADPDVMVIACCGFDAARTLAEFPSLQQRPGFDRLRCVQAGEVHIIDGNAYFNRPGPRLVDSLEILAHLLHPKLHPKPQDFAGVLTPCRFVNDADCE